MSSQLNKIWNTYSIEIVHLKTLITFPNANVKLKLLIVVQRNKIVNQHNFHVKRSFHYGLQCNFLQGEKKSKDKT